ncbi:MAG: alpha-glucosidase C-terminal domain-containing protein, partial [Candidatus Sulfotelmatobacter sp.]
YKEINQHDPNVLSYLRVYKGQGLVVALNMSGTAQKVALNLKQNGFASASNLLATGQSSAQGNEVSLEPYGVFIGELTK